MHGLDLGDAYETMSRCSRSWLFNTENTTVGETGARVRVRGLEGADARSGDPAIDPDDAARWPRLTCHTPPTTRGVTGDQRLIVRTVLINGRVPQRVALLPV